MNSKEIFKLLIIVGIILVAWVGYGVYIANTTTTIPEFNLQISEPIDPNLDLETLKGLSSKLYYK